MSNIEKNSGIEAILADAGVDVSAPDLLDGAAISMLLVGVDRHVVYANQATIELLGYSIDEMIGKDIDDLISVGDHKTVNDSHEKLVKGGVDRVVAERFYQHKNGSIVPVISSVFVYANSALEPQIVAVQLLDVRAQRHAEAELADNRRRLEFALEISRQGVWDSNRLTGEVYYSDMWYQIRGLETSDRENLAAEWRARLHPDDAVRVLDIIRRQDAGDTSISSFEYRERHVEGHWIWIRSCGCAVEWDEDRAPIRTIGTDTDITPLKSSELKLEQISSRLELALEASKVGVWELDLATGQVKWDESIKEIYHRADIEGANIPKGLWEAMLHPDDREMTVELVRCAIEAKTDAEWTCRIILPDYSVRHIQTTARYYVDGNGTAKLLGVDRDITATMSFAEELRFSKDAAEQKNELLELAHASVEAMSHRLEMALSVSKVGVWEINLDTNEVTHDDRVKDMYGYPHQPGEPVTMDMWKKAIHIEDVERVTSATNDAITNKSALEIDYRIRRSDGEERFIRAFSRFYVDSDGVQKFLGVDRDVTDEIVVAEELKLARDLSEQRNQELEMAQADMAAMSFRLEMAVSTSGVGVWELDINSGRVVWDEIIKEMYSADIDDITDVPAGTWEKALHPYDLEKALADEVDAIKNKARLNTKFRIRRPDGSVRHIQESARYYVDRNGDPKFIGVNRDITDEVRAAEDLKEAKFAADQKNALLEVAHADMEYNSLHDALTGLPNRRYLDETLRGFANKRDGAALLHIDLDRFKQINDTLGHAAGDAMLIYAANVLRDNVAKNDFVARVGGDEFVVFVDEPKSNENLAAMANRIIAKMSEPVDYQGHECRFGVSIGITTETGNDFKPSQMLVNADISLYLAKEKGRNRFEFFTREMQAEIITTKTRADEILTGLEQNQFFAYYQPQFDARSFAIVGVEALVRWDHPTEGILAPAAFLKIAQDLNVVAKIDRLILEQSLVDLDDWFLKDLGIPKVSVNVSARRLQDEELIASLGELDFRPGSLSFELLESIFLDESEEVMNWNIDKIRELGIGIDIDDFGTGHASIVGLLKLSPDRLKIDQQLIKPIAHSRQQRSLVKSIIEIGKSLGIQIVAEGVETMEHVRILQLLGCDTLQGYAFAKPMSAQDLEQFARTKTWGKVIPSAQSSY